MSLDAKTWVDGGRSELVIQPSGTVLSQVKPPAWANGTDQFGSFVGVAFYWAKSSSTAAFMQTSIRAYPDAHELVMFSQKFLQDYSPSRLPPPPTVPSCMPTRTRREAVC